MRLVADTNVIVSRLLWLGNPGRLLEAAALGRVTLYTSPALLKELHATLSAPKLARPITRSGFTVDDLIKRYLNVAIVVHRPPWRVSCSMTGTTTKYSPAPWRPTPN